MSIGTIGLTVNWVFEGDFRNKIARIKAQFYTAIILSSGYLIHLLWLLNSDNLQYASKDLLVKLPLFLIPLIIGSSANLNKFEKKIILKLFFVGVLISTVLSSLGLFSHFTTKRKFRKCFSNCFIHVSHSNGVVGFFYFYSAFLYCSTHPLQV